MDSSMLIKQKSYLRGTNRLIFGYKFIDRHWHGVFLITDVDTDEILYQTTVPIHRIQRVVYEHIEKDEQYTFYSFYVSVYANDRASPIMSESFKRSRDAVNLKKLLTRGKKTLQLKKTLRGYIEKFIEDKFQPHLNTRQDTVF